MQLIRSIVAIDDNAKFRSDVQLDLFEDAQENEVLLRDYLFSVVAPGRAGIKETMDVSPVDLLNQLVEAYAAGMENRFVTIANYGHGKSHLALVLANYFSKPFASAEVKQVLDKLEHALNNPAQLARYTDFKFNRGEFLVIRLRGDVPGNIREQFVPKLEQALAEHPATADVKVPVWHTYAEQLLNSLTGDELRRAEAALADSHYDLPTLLSDVCQRCDVRDLVIKALTAAKNMAPDLEAELDLSKTLEWIADELCGEGKPLGGVLILFDEFSMYVSRYAQRNVIGELQNLLNGVSNRTGKLLFLAFAQQDPKTVAENAKVSEATLSSIRHELTRIRKQLALKTLLESVIDAYLRQRESQWREFVQDRKIEGALSRANNITYQTFDKRYSGEFKWDHDRFFDSVTRGSFPLHPLTTALLCNLQFSVADGVGDPRTVLGFVMENLQDKREQPAVVGGAPNWVLPTALVNYFEKRVAPDLYASYQNAHRSLAPEAGEAERNMLKALYLYDAAQLNLLRDDQLSVLAEAAGLAYEETKDVLRRLHGDSVIRQDSTKRVYSLWPANVDPYKLEQLLRRKLENHAFDRALLDKLNNKLANNFGYGPLRMSIAWGHPEDWTAQTFVLTREFFTKEMLGLLAARFDIKAGSLEEGVRGAVIWLVARSEEDMQWFQHEAPQLVDQLVPADAPLPLLVMLPAQATPDVLAAFQRFTVLNAMSQAERIDVGITIYDHEVQQVQRLLISELKSLIGESGNYHNMPRAAKQMVVPLAYRASINAVQQHTLDKVLDELYRQAYRYGPTEFFPQYRVATSGNNRLREAVKFISNIMLRAKTAALTEIGSTNPVARDLADMLRKSKWGLLSSKNQLQPPMDSHILAAWRWLDESFPVSPHEVQVRKPLLALLNPLYGYDYNTLTLLFSAWIGYHLHDLDFRIGGRTAQVSDLASALERGPRDFFVNIAVTNPLSLVRRDPGDGWRNSQAILEKLQPGVFTIKQAIDNVAVLMAFEQDVRGNADQREQAHTGALKLQDWLKEAQKYEQDVQKIDQVAANGERYSLLIDTLASLAGLPHPALIISASTPADMQRKLLARMEKVVETECVSRSKPRTSGDVALYRRDLQRMRVSLDAAKHSPLVAVVDRAIEQLDRTEQQLEKQQAEKQVIAQIASVSVDGSFSYLVEQRAGLQALDGYSSTVTALRESKIKKLGESIHRLEEIVSTADARMDALHSAAEAERYRDTLLKLSTPFQGTQHEAAFNGALERTKEIGEFFRHLRESAARPIQAPDDEQAALDALATMNSRYNGSLGPAQVEALKAAQAEVRTKADSLRRAAADWLAQRKLQFARGDTIQDLASKLAKPPLFLGPDESAELAELSAQVQERIDGDVVLQVEQLFRRIVNRIQQERCLVSLHLIVEETMATNIPEAAAPVTGAPEKQW